MPSTFDTPGSSHTSSSSPARSIPDEFHHTDRLLVQRYHGNSEHDLNASSSTLLFQELARVHLDDERRFQDELDLQSKEQARRHREALEQALREHEELRQAAEVARQRLELQIQQERQRRAVEEQKALDEERRKLADQQHLETTRQLHEARQAEDRRRLIAQQEQQLQDQKRAAEAQKQKEHDEKRRREEEFSKAANAAEVQRPKVVQQSHEHVNGGPASPAPPRLGHEARSNGSIAPAAAHSSEQIKPTPAAHASQKSPVAPPTRTAGTTSSQNEREVVHERYLSLHQRLKKFRKQFEDMKDAWTKDQRNKFRDWKSAVTTGVAQTSKADAAQSTKAKNKVRDAIVEAVKFVPEPRIDISEYIVSYPIPPGTDTKASVVLLYLLNLFAKCAIKQFCAENLDQERANPIGIQVVQIFAFQDFQLLGSVPLIDILWAKFHVECPILFGIWGLESTNEGKMRLGWQTDSDRSPYSLESKALVKAGQKLQWVKSQAHHDRIAGIANGFAAITLRNFTRVKMANPAPNRMYWEAVARITNVTAAEVTLSHFTVLKALIDGHVPRFISIYGQAALVALRHAVVDFPIRVKPAGVQNMPGQWLAVDALPVQLKKELKITL